MGSMRLTVSERATGAACAFADGGLIGSPVCGVAVLDCPVAWLVDGCCATAAVLHTLNVQVAMAITELSIEDEGMRGVRCHGATICVIARLHFTICIQSR